jgi:hypothetical protein
VMPEEVSVESSARPVESRADQIWKGSHYVINR